MIRTRSAVLAGVFVMALAGRAYADEAKVATASTVVFICEHGSSKSLVAATLFNQIAEQRGLAVRAVSQAASTQTVDARVPPRLVQKMFVDGFQVKALRPQAVTAADTTNATRVVVIGYDGNVDAIGNVPIERWNDVPPASLEYDDAKREIIAHIEALLQGVDAGGSR